MGRQELSCCSFERNAGASRLLCFRDVGSACQLCIGVLRSGSHLFRLHLRLSKFWTYLDEVRDFFA